MGRTSSLGGASWKGGGPPDGWSKGGGVDAVGGDHQKKNGAESQKGGGKNSSGTTSSFGGALLKDTRSMSVESSFSQKSYITNEAVAKNPALAFTKQIMRVDPKATLTSENELIKQISAIEVTARTSTRLSGGRGGGAGATAGTATSVAKDAEPKNEDDDFPRASSSSAPAGSAGAAEAAPAAQTIPPLPDSMKDELTRFVSLGGYGLSIGPDWMRVSGLHSHNFRRTFGPVVADIDPGKSLENLGENSKSM